MENGKDMGSQRTAASILFLWGLLYAIVEMVVMNGMGASRISMSAVGWISRLCSLGMIVLLFRGKRNIGFTIILGLQALLAVRYAIVVPGINTLIWLAADATMLILVIFATMPSSFERKNPFKNLEFIPAGLHMLPYILILFTAQPQIGAMYYVNAITGSLAWWLMARALTSDRVQQSAHTVGTNAFSTVARYAPPPQVQPMRPAPSSAASQDSGPGVLLVRFSIDKLNRLSGPYGFQSGKLVGQAVPPYLLEGMTISDGDSAATLRGSEYVCIVSISTVSKRSVLRERIEPLILASEDIKACGVSPLTQVADSTNEPLVVDGIVRNGKIEGSGGWCANGFMSAWKEQSEAPSKPETTSGYAPGSQYHSLQAQMPQPQGCAVLETQAGIPLPNRFCMHCGQRLMAGAAFCGACGATVNVSAQPMPPQQAAVPAAPVMPPVAPQSVPVAATFVPSPNAHKQRDVFYAFAVQGPAFGMAGGGDMVLEKAQTLKDGYEPAKDMELKIIRPGQWNASVQSGNSGGVITVSYNFGTFKDGIRAYLLKEGIPDGAIEKGIKLCEENSLQLSNPMSGVFVMGIPLAFESNG